MGDLGGVTEKLPYLKRLGVDAVWLSPLDLSPQHDAGYDVAHAPHPRIPASVRWRTTTGCGVQAHRLGLKIIVDRRPTTRPRTTSGSGPPWPQHPVHRNVPATSSGEGRGENGEAAAQQLEVPVRRFRVDSCGGRPVVPAPSTSPSGIWTWKNPEVWEEFRAILRFWLDRGADGFRVDVAHGMIKAEGLPDWDEQVHMVEGTAEAG
ncbi:alpha-amylase family glycosyl hydrolase [Kocuria rhizophila]|nr:alpha-amylase family glycosyl hydrolase [Kocuria rhizophila]